MGVETLAPSGAGIGKKDVNMISCLGYFGDETFDLTDFGGVGRNRDSAGVGFLVGKSI